MQYKTKSNCRFDRTTSTVFLASRSRLTRLLLASSSAAVILATQFPQALSHDNSHFDSIHSSAAASFQRMHFEQSRQIWEQICSLPGATATDFYWLGESNYHLGRYQNALTAFEQSLSLDKKSGITQVRLVETYISLGRFQDARQACSNAIVVLDDQYSISRLRLTQKVLSKLSLLGTPRIPKRTTGQVEK